jgi:hypothetical protein
MPDSTMRITSFSLPIQAYASDDQKNCAGLKPCRANVIKSQISHSDECCHRDASVEMSTVTPQKGFRALLIPKKSVFATIMFSDATYP